jgi:uncharacterized protein (DUF2249 family)
MNPESVPSVHELDVRPILAAGGGPFGAILEAVRALPPRGALRLIAPFEPKPLYARLGEMGFDHTTHPRDDGTWEILFTPRAEANAPEPVWLDLRSLEPPEPLRRVLETLAQTPAGGTLIAQTRFRPVHLLSMLDERGLAWECNEQPDGSWETVLTNSPAA